MAQQIIDMSDPVAKTELLQHIRSLTGLYRLELVRHRPRRSDRANRYYWPCIVAVFGQWLREQGEHYTDLQAHELLKHKFLRITRELPNGEHIDATRSTTELDTACFNEYVDMCCAWLAEFGIVVAPPRTEDLDTDD